MAPQLALHVHDMHKHVVLRGPWPVGLMSAALVVLGSFTTYSAAQQPAAMWHWVALSGTPTQCACPTHCHRHTALSVLR